MNRKRAGKKLHCSEIHSLCSQRCLGRTFLRRNHPVSPPGMSISHFITQEAQRQHHITSFPCSVPRVHCAMALKQHKILQMREESTNKHHFMALIPEKPWEVSLVAKPIWLLLISSELHSLRLQRGALCTDHFVSQSGNTQSEVDLVHVWESHIHFPLSH